MWHCQCITWDVHYPNPVVLCVYPGVCVWGRTGGTFEASGVEGVTPQLCWSTKVQVWCKHSSFCEAVSQSVEEIHE